MSENTARLTLPFIQAAQAQKHVTHNDALRLLDVVVQLTVESFGAETPPTSPGEGQVWALGEAPGGAWAGQAGRLALWSDEAWSFVAPSPGWRAASGTELRIWSGSAWVPPAVPALQNLPGLGLNTEHDATNRLAVAAGGTLFTHEGGGHQVKLNKAASADTASLLFQTGFAGRAEFGLAGNDDFSVKVSPDGAAWHDSLSADRMTGLLRAAAGMQVTGLLTGTAVTQSRTDTTANRLLKVGDFGFGGAAITLTEAHDLNALPAAGACAIYTWGAAASGPANAPTAFCQMLHLVRNAGTMWQIAMTVPGAVWFRALSAGNWSAWRRLDAERGSNANGEYVRFADGTQICQADVTVNGGHTVSGGGGFQSQTPTAWTYPAQFVAGSTPAVIVTIRNSGAAGGVTSWAGIGGRTATSVNISLHGLASNSANRSVMALATGRWF